MKIWDPIYGAFTVPGFISELLTAPEVRRLSNIRLLNTLTPSLATLGEVRRYSHTLGVIFLATKHTFFGYDDPTIRAFFAAVLLHDIGTPPFGHLFEYHLRERFDWHHEAVITDVIQGLSSPENTSHPIYFGKAIQFLEQCRTLGVDEKILFEIVSRKHPLSQMIFGTLDFDNLDNVVRMAWALGMGFDRSLSPELAAALNVGADGSLHLSRETGLPLVSAWSALRRAVYEVLVFDGPTVAAQAVLSTAIREAFDTGTLSTKDWEKHDEDLITFLRENRRINRQLMADYTGRLPELVLCAQIPGSLADIGQANRKGAEDLGLSALYKYFPKHHFLSYAFIDRGAFEKQLKFRDSKSGEDWELGKNSQSVVLYAFTRQRSALDSGRLLATKRDLLQCLRSYNPAARICA